MIAIATTVLASCGKHRPLRRQGREPRQPGDHRHERPFVPHHLERHLREPEKVVANDQKGEDPGGDAQDGKADERLRPGCAPAPDPLEDRQGQQADSDRPPGEGIPPHRLRHLRQDRHEALARRHREAHEIGALGRDEEQADRRGVPDDDRTRNKLGHLAEVEEAGQKLRDADEKGEVGRQGQRVKSEAGIVPDRGRRDQADRGRRAEHVIVRREEQRAEEAADHDREDHGHWRQSQDQGKTDGLGDGDERQRRPGNEIRAESLPAIVPELPDEREADPEHLGPQRLGVRKGLPDSFRNTHAGSGNTRPVNRFSPESAADRCCRRIRSRCGRVSAYVGGRRARQGAW